MTQPTVCYRLQRASARIKFLVELPDLTIEQIQNDLEEVLVDPLDVKIMVQMYQTTCQSEVAKNLSVSQGLVRHRFIRSIKRLGFDGYDELVAVYKKISENLNILSGGYFRGGLTFRVCRQLACGTHHGSSRIGFDRLRFVIWRELLHARSGLRGAESRHR